MNLKSFFLFFWRKINSKNRKFIRDFCKDIWLDVIGANLSQMANVYGTDKHELHGYTAIYTLYFDALRKSSFDMLEIGIGGGSNNESGGGSLRMWKKYFPKAQIVGIDIYDKSFFDEKRIKTLVGNQSDSIFLDALTREYNFEVIIDDGSHMSFDVVSSFLSLYPKMSSKGLYIIEDIHACSFDTDKKYQGLSSIEFFRSLIDFIPSSTPKASFLNEKWLIDPINFIHFYPKMIIIQKK